MLIGPGFLIKVWAFATLRRIQLEEEISVVSLFLYPIFFTADKIIRPLPQNSEKASCPPGKGFFWVAKCFKFGWSYASQKEKNPPKTINPNSLAKNYREKEIFCLKVWHSVKGDILGSDLYWLHCSILHQEVSGRRKEEVVIEKHPCSKAQNLDLTDKYLGLICSRIQSHAHTLFSQPANPEWVVSFYIIFFHFWKSFRRAKTNKGTSEYHERMNYRL